MVDNLYRSGTNAHLTYWHSAFIDQVPFGPNVSRTQTAPNHNHNQNPNPPANPNHTTGRNHPKNPTMNANIKKKSKSQKNRAYSRFLARGTPQRHPRGRTGGSPGPRPLQQHLPREGMPPHHAITSSRAIIRGEPRAVETRPMTYHYPPGQRVISDSVEGHHRVVSESQSGATGCPKTSPPQLES